MAANGRYETLQAKDNDLHLSATIGKRLVEENGTLSANLDATVAEFSARLEELQQQNHKLRQDMRQDSTDKLISQELERENNTLKEQVDLSHARCDKLQKAVEKSAKEAAEREELHAAELARCDFDQCQLVRAGTEALPVRFLGSAFLPSVYTPAPAPRQPAAPDETDLCLLRLAWLTSAWNCSRKRAPCPRPPPSF